MATWPFPFKTIWMHACINNSASLAAARSQISALLKYSAIRQSGNPLSDFIKETSIAYLLKKTYEFLIALTKAVL